MIEELRVNGRREILPTYRVITPAVCAMSEKVGAPGIEPGSENRAPPPSSGDGGYAAFEWVGKKDYLKEPGAHVRGANVTSLNALMRVKGWAGNATPRPPTRSGRPRPS